MAEQVLWVDGVQASGQDMRRATAAGMTPSGVVLAARGGVRPGDLAVSAQTTPNMTVLVAAGQAFVQQTAAAAGQSVVTSDAAKTVPIAASDVTNPRRDLVVFRVYDETVALAGRKAQIEVVTGTPAVSPVDPAVPANSVVLARVTVAAGASTVTNANITDLRAATVSLGGITPSAGATDVAGAYAGQYRDNLVTRDLERWNGTTWVPVGAAGAWTSYTPVWSTNGTTQPGIGNGTLAGRFKLIGKTLSFRITLTMGSTSGGGTGDFRFTLPAGLTGAPTDQFCTCKAFVQNGLNYSGFAYVPAGSDLVTPFLSRSDSSTAVAPARNTDNGGAVGIGVPAIAGQYTFVTGSNLTAQGTIEVT